MFFLANRGLRLIFKDKKSGLRRKATMYEFKHIHGRFRAYKTKQELEKALKL